MKMLEGSKDFWVQVLWVVSQFSCPNRWLRSHVVLRRRKMTSSSSLSLAPPAWFRLSRRYDVGEMMPSRSAPCAVG